MGNRQLHHAAVRELECILDNAFSECRRSDNRSDAVISDCSREDFCRTCRIFIDQHDEWNRDRGIAVAGILFPFSIFILCIHDESLRQDLAQGVTDCRHEAARIAAQIDDQALHALALQFLDLGFKLISSHTVKLHNGNISDLFIQHLA